MKSGTWNLQENFTVSFESFELVNFIQKWSTDSMNEHNRQFFLPDILSLRSKQVAFFLIALLNMGIDLPKQNGYYVVTKFIRQYSFLPFSKRFRSVYFYVIVRLFRVIVGITFLFVGVFAPSFYSNQLQNKQTKIENRRFCSLQLLLCVSNYTVFYRIDLTIILIALAK